MKKVPTTATKEGESVGLITQLLSKSTYILTDIKLHDKYPLHDGEVTVLTDNKEVLGDIKIQVRTLNSKGTLSQDIEIDILNYAAKQSLVPFIVIFVDTKSEIAYWLHLDQDYVSGLKIKPKQKTKRIHFDKTKKITRENAEFVGEWRAILEKYFAIKDVNKQLYADFIEISSKSNVLAGEESKFIEKINIFLWEYHKLVDNKFEIIREVLYPQAWKIGFAYSKFTENEVFFAPYRIPLNKNDIQIKKINDKEMSEYLYKGGFHGYSQENPIYDNPSKFAKGWVKRELNIITRAKALPKPFSVELVREFIFAFVDRYDVQLGLEQRNAYSLEELEFAFNTFLPIWTHEVMQFLLRERRDNIVDTKQLLHKERYFDANSLKSYLKKEELQEISKKVTQIVEKPLDKAYEFLLGDSTFAIQLFPKAIQYCKAIQMKSVTRLYKNELKKHIFSNNIDFCKNHLEQVYGTVFENYEQVLKQNFPKSWKELSILKDISEVIIQFKFDKDINRSLVKIKYMTCSGNSEKTNISVLDEKDTHPLLKVDWRQPLTLEGAVYKLIKDETSGLDALFSNTPQSDLIYRFLRESIQNHFN